jgi:hypothetical protein
MAGVTVIFPLNCNDVGGSAVAVTFICDMDIVLPEIVDTTLTEVVALA